MKLKRSALSLAIMTAAITGPVSASMFGDITNGLQQINKLVELTNKIQQLNPMNIINSIKDLSNASSLAAYILGPAIEYVGMAELPEMPFEESTVVSAISAGVNELRPDQKKPTNIAEDWMSMVSSDITYSCIEYMFLGNCYQLKTSWIPKIRVRSVGQNYVADQQVEVSSRINTPDEPFFGNSSYAPSDMFSGGTVQWTGAYLTRLLDFTGGLKGKAVESQVQANQSSLIESTDAQIWREAMVIGNPSKPLAPSIWSSMPGYCSGNSAPYVPYYHSGLDQLSWRLLATTEAGLLATHTLEELSWNTLGGTGTSLFPRMGIIDTNNKYAASLTAAARAASIVNETDSMYSGLTGLHVVMPASEYSMGSLTRKGDYRYYQTKQNLDHLKFRETFPENTNTCKVFKYSSSEIDKRSHEFESEVKEGSLAMKIYKPFVCCPRTGKYLFTLAFSPSIGH